MDSVTSMDELNDVKNEFSAGDTITLLVYRKGVSTEVNVVLSEVRQN